MVANKSIGYGALRANDDVVAECLLLLAGGTFPPSFSGCADKYAWFVQSNSEQWKPTAP
jgi:hypothetical protein